MSIHSIPFVVVSSDQGPSLRGAVKLLLESEFNCSSQLHWSSMVTLLASKSDSFSSKELDTYSQCIATAQSKCLLQTSRGKFESRLLQRYCHKWSEMKFLSGEGAGRKDARFIALTSYPGSGNTWVRMILEELTGVFTGSIYCDTNLLFSGLFGAFVVSNRVLVAKTHQSSLKGARGVIVIVRNPYHAIISSLAFKTTRSHSAAVSFGEWEYIGWKHLDKCIDEIVVVLVCVCVCVCVRTPLQLSKVDIEP